MHSADFTKSFQISAWTRLRITRPITSKALMESVQRLIPFARTTRDSPSESPSPSKSIVWNKSATLNESAIPSENTVPSKSPLILEQSFGHSWAMRLLQLRRNHAGEEFHHVPTPKKLSFLSVPSQAISTLAKGWYELPNDIYLTKSNTAQNLLFKSPFPHSQPRFFPIKFSPSSNFTHQKNQHHLSKIIQTLTSDSKWPKIPHIWSLEGIEVLPLLPLFISRARSANLASRNRCRTRACSSSAPQ